jgi:hypothetical protein
MPVRRAKSFGLPLLSWRTPLSISNPSASSNIVDSQVSDDADDLPELLLSSGESSLDCDDDEVDVPELSLRGESDRDPRSLSPPEYRERAFCRQQGYAVGYEQAAIDYGHLDESKRVNPADSLREAALHSAWRWEMFRLAGLEAGILVPTKRPPSLAETLSLPPPYGFPAMASYPCGSVPPGTLLPQPSFCFGTTANSLEHVALRPSPQPKSMDFTYGLCAQALLQEMRSTDAYADSGATYHCTDDMTSLRCIVACNVFCGGVGAGITFSHVGIDPRLPIGLRKTLYHPDAARLLSTGYLSSTGRGAYIQQADGTLHFYVDGKLLFSAPRQRNNLYPTPLVEMRDHPSVRPADLTLDHEYARQLPPPLDCPSGFPRGAVQSLLLTSVATVYPAPSAPAVAPVVLPVTPNLTPAQFYYSPICESDLLSEPLALAALGGLNSEQRRRVDQADELVRFLGYPAIDSVATSVSMGSFALSSPLDAKDLRNLYTVRGPSPHYYAGYFHQKHALVHYRTCNGPWTYIVDRCPQAQCSFTEWVHS